MDNFSEHQSLMKEMVKINTYRKRVDIRNLWEYYLPNLPCNCEDIRNIENQLCVKLDNDYANFLLCANGWNCFNQMIDLFGTDDLISDKMVKAKDLLFIELIHSEGLKLLEDRLLPIAVSRDDIDLFVIVLGNGEFSGNVIWLAGGVIEKFESFSEFFRTMMKYNMREINRLIKNNNL